MWYNNCLCLKIKQLTRSKHNRYGRWQRHVLWKDEIFIAWLYVPGPPFTRRLHILLATSGTFVFDEKDLIRGRPRTA